MASRMNVFRNLCRQAVRSARKPCTAVSFVIVASCAGDDTSSSPKLPKPLKLLDTREMTHEALIRQACTLTANSSSQLLTQVLIAINDTSEGYRKAMSELMLLLENNILFISNSRTSSLNEVEDLIVEQRNIVDEHRRAVLELVSLMDYVEKMVTSTAETAFLAGAEQSSALMCERLNSALNKVVEECAANKRSEEELLRLQAAYVVKLGELYEREWEGKEQTEPGGMLAGEEEMRQVTPLDVFETVLTQDENDTEPDSKLLD